MFHFAGAEGPIAVNFYGPWFQSLNNDIFSTILSDISVLVCSFAASNFRLRPSMMRFFCRVFVRIVS